MTITKQSLMPSATPERQKAAEAELARLVALGSEWPHDVDFVFRAVCGGWSLDHARQEYAKARSEAAA